jgi:hypothetical protein
LFLTSMGYCGGFKGAGSLVTSVGSHDDDDDDDEVQGVYDTFPARCPVCSSQVFKIYICTHQQPSKTRTMAMEEAPKSTPKTHILRQMGVLRKE